MSVVNPAPVPLSAAPATSSDGADVLRAASDIDGCVASDLAVSDAASYSGRFAAIRRQFGDLVETIKKTLLQRNSEALAAQAADEAAEQAQAAAEQAQAAAEQAQAAAEQAGNAPLETSPSAQTTSVPNQPSDSQTPPPVTQPIADDDDGPQVHVLTDEEAHRQARHIAVAIVRTGIAVQTTERNEAEVAAYTQAFVAQAERSEFESAAFESMMAESMRPFPQTQRALEWNQYQDQADLDDARRSLTDDDSTVPLSYDCFALPTGFMAPPIDSHLSVQAHESDERRALREARRLDGTL